MPAQQLSEEEVKAIWRIVLETAEQQGGYAGLFSRPLQFETVDGRVRFLWPEWMQQIRAFLQARYDERQLQNLLIQVFNDVSTPARFTAQQQSLTTVGGVARTA